MTMLAQNTFTVKRATKDGYSCSLSSYSVMLNADSNGIVNGLSAASTTVKLYQGSTVVTPVISIDSVSNCSASISGLNVSIVSVPNNTKSGYVDIKIVYGSFVKIERYSFTVVDYTIVKNYTQTIVGDQMTSYATKKAVDTLGQTVSDHTTAIRQNSEDITLKASQSDVNNLGDRMKTAEASITPDAINLTVKSQIDKAVGNAQDEIKSSFSIGADGISMLGKKISLAGMVSFKSLSDYSDVNGRISTAQTTANDAKDSLGALTKSLGGLAYKSLVEQAMKEEGLISGAFIKMSLIDVKNVVAQGISAQTIDAGNATFKNLNVDTVKMTNADVSGKITANTGTIGALRIDGNKLTNEGSDSDAAICLWNISNGTSVRIGENVLSSTTGMMSTAIFQNNRKNSPNIPVLACVCEASGSRDSNIGLYINATGTTQYDDDLRSGNHAIYIPTGNICGFRPRGRSISSSKTLDDMDCIIFTKNTNTITLTLPSSPQYDQFYFIKRCESGGVNINAYPNSLSFKNYNSRMTTWSPGWQGVFLNWDKSSNMWWASLTVGM